VVPTYNDEAFLGEALASVAGQTARPAQVIVVDDGSATRAAESLVERANSQTGLGIDYVRRPANRGLPAARNTGLELARQPYLAYLDADDRWMPDHLSLKLDRLAQRGERYSTAYDSYQNVDERGRPRWTMPSGDHDGPIVAGLLGVRGGIPAGAPFHLHRRAALLEIGGFDEELRMGEDFDLLLRLGRAGFNITGGSRPTVWRRLRSASLTTADPTRTVAEIGRFLDKAERERLLPADVARSMRKAVRVWMARTQLQPGGDARLAARLLTDAFALERPRGAGQWLLFAASRRGVPPAILRGAAAAQRLRRGD
jgi:glycosyltransferase involved in cell wall biosynthesis